MPGAQSDCIGGRKSSLPFLCLKRGRMIRRFRWERLVSPAQEIDHGKDGKIKRSLEKIRKK